jgi:hypothetical protein
MLSMRRQAWVIKINDNDGAGDGSIMWKLGYQGDFNLLPGTHSQPVSGRPVVTGAGATSRTILVA